MSLKSLLKEPLLHFLAIGAAPFLVFHFNGGGAGPGSQRIVISSGQIEHPGGRLHQGLGAPAHRGRAQGPGRRRVREEIAVREAMATGLDRDDTVIRRRLRPKLEFLAEDSVEAAAPTDTEVQAWLTQHADRFRTEPRVAFCQVFISRDRLGAATEAVGQVGHHTAGSCPWPVLSVRLLSRHRLRSPRAAAASSAAASSVRPCPAVTRKTCARSTRSSWMPTYAEKFRSRPLSSYAQFRNDRRCGKEV